MANSSELQMLEMQAHLQMRLQTVAQRIVEAARLAAAAHFHGAFDDSDENFGQRVAIGGAGPVSPADARDSRPPHRPPRAGYATDGDTPAPQPPAHRAWRFDPAD